MIPDLDIGPLMWLGGNLADYTVRVGPSGTLNTLHRLSGRSIQSVMPSPGEVADRGRELGAGASKMIEHGRTAAAVAQNAAQMATALGAVNVGLNVLNLGVSCYNAYQLHKVRQGIDDLKESSRQTQLEVRQLAEFVQSGFAEVRDVLEQQSIVLGLLRTGQRELGGKLDLLRDEMRQEFADVHAHLLDQEARQERRELLERLHRLWGHYGALVDVVSEGLDPKPTQLQSVIEAATDARAWLAARLADLAAGDPARLPFFAAQRSVLQMLHDARRFTAGGRNVSRREVRELAAEISKETFALCDGRSMFELGVSRAYVLRQYVFLRRSLLETPEIAVSEDTGAAIALWDLRAALWDDGLSSLRRIAEESTEGAIQPDATVELQSLEDQRWLLDYTGVAARDYVAIDKEVIVRELMASIGITESVERPLTPPELEVLKELARTSTREKLAHDLGVELGWDTAADLSGGRG